MKCSVTYDNIKQYVTMHQSWAENAIQAKAKTFSPDVGTKYELDVHLQEAKHTK